MLSCSQCPEAGDSDESSDSWPRQFPSGCPPQSAHVPSRGGYPRWLGHVFFWGPMLVLCTSVTRATNSCIKRYLQWGSKLGDLQDSSSLKILQYKVGSKHLNTIRRFDVYIYIILRQVSKAMFWQAWHRQSKGLSCDTSFWTHNFWVVLPPTNSTSV